MWPGRDDLVAEAKDEIAKVKDAQLVSTDDSA